MTSLLYLDSSAIVKLVQRETESAALRRYLRSRAGDRCVTSTLARAEVVRAVLDAGPAAVARARRQLQRLDQVQVSVDLLDRASTLAHGSRLRTLDAVHLAAAALAGPALRAVLTYDVPMADAAALLGLAVEAPA